jgi:hypothetical protein
LQKQRTARLIKICRKKGKLPPMFPSKRGGHPGNVSRMAYNRSNSDNKNTRGRCTPADLRMGIFAEKTEKKPPRPITKEEQHANNISMVEMGEIIGSFLKWNSIYVSELREMNRNKVGRPWEFADSLIAAILSLMVFRNDTFRAVVGFVRPLFETIGIKVPSPSRLLERANELAGRNAVKPDAELKERYGDRVLALFVNGNIGNRVRRCGIDSTGISMSSVNMWKKKKHGVGTKDRGWLKIHALSDVDTGEIIAYAITDESVGDGPMLKVLVNLAVEKGHLFDTVYADNAYESIENWECVCRTHNMKFVTSFRRDTPPKNKGSSERGEATRLWCSLPYRKWVEVTGYGVRWKCECVFSDLKRIFPENVNSVTDEGIIRNLSVRVQLFNIYKAIRAENIGVTGNGIVIG